MGTKQLRAVTGRAVRSGAVDSINSMTPSLRDAALLNENRESTAKWQALKEKELADTTLWNARLLEEQKEEAAAKRRLGETELTVTGLLNAAQMAGGFENPTPAKTFFSTEGQTAGNYLEAFKEHPLATVAGPAAAYLLRDSYENWVPFGGRAEQNIAGSALAGGATSYMLSGGDLYSAAMGGVMGGVTGAVGEAVGDEWSSW